MNRFIRKLLKFVIGGAVVLGIAGCSSTSTTHSKAVDAANQRWSNVRSAVIIKSAQQYFDAGDLDQAERTLLGAVDVDPDNPRLHLLAGRVALERGQLERSHGRLQRAIDLAPKLAEARYYQGIVLQRWQRHEASLDRYRQAYDLRADSVAYLLAVAEMLVALDRTDEAITLLCGKLIYFDQNTSVRIALGQLHVLRKDHASAVAVFREALLLDPDDHTIADELALAQLASGQADDALDTLEALCRRVQIQDRPDLWRTLASAYRQANRLGQARAVARELRDAAPDDAENWLLAGELAWLGQDMTAALAAAQQAIGVAPRRYEGYMLAGMVWQKRKNTEKAMAMFDRAAALSPKSAEPEILRGISLQQAGRDAEAAEAYGRALRRRPGDDRVKGLLSAVSTRIGSDSP